MKRRLVWVLAAVGAFAISPAPATAQDSLDLSILNAGKAPSTPVAVSVIDDGRKVAVTRTDGNGNASIDFDMLNLGKGTPVQVNLVTRDGRQEVVLVPPGEVSDDCEEARRDDDDDCRTLGVILWGQTTAARIDVSRGGSMTTGAAATSAVGASSAVSTDLWKGYSRPRFGVSATWSNFTNLEDTGCALAGVTACDVDDSGIGVKAFYEFGSLWSGKRAFLGLGGGYKTASVTQTYSSLGTNKVDLDIWSLGAYLGWRFSLGPRFEVSPVFDFSWYFNSGDVTTDFGSEITESRSESGLRLGPGLDLDYRFAEHLGIRGGFRYMFGDSDDADTHIELSAGLTYTF